MAISGLTINDLKSLSCGRRNKIKGWMLNKPKARKKAKAYTLVNVVTDKAVYISEGLEQFSIKNNLCADMVNKLITGKISRYKDWVKKNTYDLVYKTPLAKIYN